MHTLGRRDSSTWSDRCPFNGPTGVVGFESHISLSNTTLPSIIHAANYLIIPYPRHVVLVIELLPALLAKLSLPFVAHRVPRRRVADDTPPNNAVWPFLLTYGAGEVLRSAAGCVHRLVVVLLVSHFVLLPQSLAKRGSENGDERRKDRGDDDDDDDDDDDGADEEGRKSRTLRALAQSGMLPLAVASASLSLLQRGLARPLDGSAFETVSHFFAIYGAAMHLGSLLGRSSIAFLPVRGLRPQAVALSVWTVVAFFNAAFLASTHIAFFLAFLAGFAGGSLYVNVLARVAGEERKSQSDRELSLGLVTAGETGGMMVGGAAGAFLETAMCGSLVSSRRWCHR
ncbi:hypothetical protein LY76DRAFT_626756 [Colletotrichum caudatum]|nr:hypothetical protein LY76DRAFT_626756 [Colletotrichum caudatum]